jgi:HTH-type transcriptional regulator / antitoxin HipB
VIIASAHDLASAVRGRRQDLGLTQADVAHQIGVSRKWLNDFELGKPTAQIGIVLRLIEALDLQIELVPASGAGPSSAVDLDALIDQHQGRRSTP